MKKYVLLLAAVAVIFSLAAGVRAEETELHTVGLEIFTEVPEGWPKAQTLVFDIRDGETNQLIDSRSVTLGDEKEPVFRFDFDVPPYEIGKSFILHMSQGDALLEYDGQIGAYFILQTFNYPDSEGQWVLNHTDFQMMLRPAACTQEERFINSTGIASDTDYLVWVSKSEYMVRVFLGKAGDWRMINSFDCAIGAPSTPTVEGTYKYYQYQDRWYYDYYYCGPVMRFYRGYAIHSTLLRYNGGDYDRRTGERVSHGCVRVIPENINWLVSTVPLQTTIYVTA